LFMTYIKKTQEVNNRININDLIAKEEKIIKTTITVSNIVI